VTDYHHDYAAFDEHVLCAPWMVEEMARRAAKVLARAEMTAPFDPDSKDGTHYRDAFAMTAGIRVAKTRRAFGRVSNDDAAAVFVEFGTKNNPRHRTLGNALDAAGD
jgi:hypothetical protein